MIPRYQAALLASLATMELLTVQEGRVMSSEACTEFKRSYQVYRSAMNWLANENLRKKKMSVPHPTQNPPVIPHMLGFFAVEPSEIQQLPR